MAPSNPALSASSKTKAGRRPARSDTGIRHRVGKTAGPAHDRYCPIAQRIKLRQAARLEPRRRQQNIRTCLQPVRQGFVIADMDRNFLRDIGAPTPRMPLPARVRLPRQAQIGRPRRPCAGMASRIMSAIFWCASRLTKPIKRRSRLHLQAKFALAVPPCRAACRKCRAR